MENCLLWGKTSTHVLTGGLGNEVFWMRSKGYTQESKSFPNVGPKSWVSRHGILILYISPAVP